MKEKTLLETEQRLYKSENELIINIIENNWYVMDKPLLCCSFKPFMII
jgi:hypothetical protein